MDLKKEFLIKKNNIESYYWAFFYGDGEIDITPTVLFAQMCDDPHKKKIWERTTRDSYAEIVSMFFRTMRLSCTSIQTITSEETQGFMQRYYMKEFPFQTKTGKPTSSSRMESVETVLKSLITQSVKFGFREIDNLSFNYKEEHTTDIDKSDYIHKCYIPAELFDQLLEHLECKTDFERDRDELALKVGYEMGLRSEELVRANNWSIKKLKTARLNWRFGEEIEWENLIGKGSGGGKARNVLIKPGMAELIFEHMDKYKVIYNKSEQLFCHSNGTKLSDKHGTNTFYNVKLNFNHPELNFKSFQKLRHSYATNTALWCIKKGIPLRLVQDRMGHSDLSTTELYFEVAHLINGNTKKSEEMRMVRLDRRVKAKMNKGHKNG
jgi:site-specific recombinase XerD